jgi:hypothetical protein
MLMKTTARFQRWLTAAIVAAVSVSGAGTRVNGQQVLSIDQQNTVGNATGGASSPNFLLGQTFTPKFNRIDAIDLRVAILAFPAQMRVTLLDGVVGIDGLQGAVLGTTSSSTITSTTRQNFRFTFPAPITLIPGNVYAMRFDPFGIDSNPQIEISSAGTPNPYSGGQALQLNIPLASLSDRDFVFAEGMLIPEPSAILLLAIAAIVGVVVRWRG